VVTDDMQRQLEALTGKKHSMKICSYDSYTFLDFLVWFVQKSVTPDMSGYKVCNNNPYHFDCTCTHMYSHTYIDCLETTNIPIYLAEKSS
jgi:hypothetical protein